MLLGGINTRDAKTGEPTSVTQGAQNKAEMFEATAAANKPAANHAAETAVAHTVEIDVAVENTPDVAIPVNRESELVATNQK
jgi:hypothetical protein